MADPQLQEDLAELHHYIELLGREAKGVQRRGRVLGRAAARAAEALTDLERRVTEDNARDNRQHRD